MTRAHRRWALALGAVLLVVLLVGGRWFALETAERAWAASLRGGAVYVAARDFARLVSGLILLTAVGWGTANLFFVYRVIGSVQLPRRLGDLEIVEAVPQRVLLGGTIASGLAFGFILALGTGDWWMAARLAATPPHFGVSDPLLHRDVGYYVGQLPWAVRAQGFALIATVTAAVIVALLYLGIGSLRFRRWRPYASTHARAHLGGVLACTALAILWGALLDPAETVAGLHGALDRGALQVRLPGAAVVAGLAVAATGASLVWTLRDTPTLLLTSWGALLGASLGVFLLVPALLRDAQAQPDVGLPQQRDSLERLAFALDWRADPPPAFPAATAAVAMLPVWDAERVAGAARRRPELLGAHAAVAGVALSPRALGDGRATWLVAAMPDLEASARAQPGPRWAEIHRAPWARAGRPLVAVESDTGLEIAPLLTRDPAAWFGPGFHEFAVAAPDSWPDLAPILPRHSGKRWSGGEARGAGIPLAGWWRRTALAWSLQSPELARAETDGLLLLWRRDVVERLERLAPFATFDAPTPLVADGGLWWVAYGYLGSETFPLARRMEWEGRPVRFLRAGLIGAVSAASGDTQLYLAPGADSLAATWARIFGPLVRPLDSLPAALRAGLPYPRQTFRIAAALVAAARTDSGAWIARPREPFELAAPDADGETRVWTAQGFETGNPREVAAVVAASVGRAGPEVLVWRPSPAVQLPSVLVGSPQPPTAPGVLRLWNVGGALFSAQALFREPAAEGPPGIDTLFLTWGERRGQGATARAALRDLLTAGHGAHLPADTSLAARWDAARGLAAQADAALAAGDLEAFGRYYKQLTELLELRRRKLAPTPGPR
ncbi:MAG TPA: UPF0182 family protein [Gemmatimonadales bacterium]|nr:UPF0182 family protein [Gemmatimonadales bacterium]